MLRKYYLAIITAAAPSQIPLADPAFTTLRDTNRDKSLATLRITE